MDDPKRLPPAPAGWGDDPLTLYLVAVANNQYAAYLSFTELYAHIREAVNLLGKLTTNLNNVGDLVSITLLQRACSAFHAAAGLAMGGQSAESYPVMRAGLEYGLYGVATRDDPDRAILWLNRHADRAIKKKIWRVFAKGKMLELIRPRDSQLADALDALYEDLIDFGAHPNERGVNSTVTLKPVDGGIVLNTGYVMTPAQPAYRLALGRAFRVGVATAALGRLMYPERFAFLGLEARLKGLRAVAEL
jgi:hypothetical protein